MKKKLSVLVAVVSALVLFAVPATPSMAACSGSDGDSRARDFSGSPDPQAPDYNPNYGQATGEDYLLKGTPLDANGDGAADATGTILYGAFNDDDDGGYIGSYGSRGYIELSGDASEGTLQVDGRTAGGEADGRVTVSSSPGVCVNNLP